MSLRRKALAIAAAAVIGGLASVATYVSAQPKEKVIKMTAKRFDYTPGHLTLKKGEPVILELTTADVLMGFNLPDFGVRADIIPGPCSAAIHSRRVSTGVSVEFAGR